MTLSRRGMRMDTTLVRAGIVVVLMPMPKRIQRKRIKGWRAPEGAVYVGRPSTFQNRWAIGVWSSHLGKRVETRAEAVKCFREVGPPTIPPLAAYIKEQLAGKDLMCWCPLEQPCHADVLLEIANS